MSRPPKTARPLPDVASHILRAINTHAQRKRANGRCAFLACFPGVAAVRFPDLPPREDAAFRPTRGLLPFRFAGQTVRFPRGRRKPPAVSKRVVPRDVDHRMICLILRWCAVRPMRRRAIARCLNKSLVLRIGHRRFRQVEFRQYQACAADVRCLPRTRPSADRCPSQRGQPECAPSPVRKVAATQTPNASMISADCTASSARNAAVPHQVSPAFLRRRPIPHQGAIACQHQSTCQSDHAGSVYSIRSRALPAFPLAGNTS